MAAEGIFAPHFDPSKHLEFTPPSKTYSMEELGFDRDMGVSPIAVSEPFPLFTQEAVMRFREEVLSKEVKDNFKIHSTVSQCQLRCFGDKQVFHPSLRLSSKLIQPCRYAPFVFEAWKSPEVRRIVSDIAGLELVPAMDIDIAHINLSEPSQDNDYDDKNATVNWHKDSYPFVCIVMLSDCSQMIGGETAIRTGTGEIMKVRGPQMVCVFTNIKNKHQQLKPIPVSHIHNMPSP